MEKVRKLSKFKGTEEFWYTLYMHHRSLTISEEGRPTVGTRPGSVGWGWFYIFLNFFFKRNNKERQKLNLANLIRFFIVLVFSASLIAIDAISHLNKWYFCLFTRKVDALPVFFFINMVTRFMKYLISLHVCNVYLGF